jgi:methionine aminotransferase
VADARDRRRRDPLSAFYDGGFEQGIARLCFAKKDETLHTALQRLARL